MGDSLDGAALVFHAGALGDFVLTWPLLRALRARGSEVLVVTRPSHVRLAERVLGVRGIAEDRPEVVRLWDRSSTGAPDRARWARTLGGWSPRVVVSFVADPAADREATWCRRVRAELRPREVVLIGPPGSESRRRAWALAEVERFGSAAARPGSPSRPVLHIGAGGRRKMWPMERWAELVERTPMLRGAEVIGGEVEAERLLPPERSLFQAMGGRVLDTLDGLVDEIIGPVQGTGSGIESDGQVPRGAGVFIGADTGPTHLAAQLGVPTLALFGPTDPDLWRPVGPRVVVVRATSGEMSGLAVGQVQEGLAALLRGEHRATGVHSTGSDGHPRA